MTSTSYTSQAYDLILGRLIRRELKPGDLLDRKKIAEEMNVSLIPVSDAVQRLTYEGFLTTRRRQGTFVSTPDHDDIRGQLLLREALECQCARLYCNGPITKAYKKLLPLAKSADKALVSGRQVWSEDFQFHQALVALTGCAALIQCFERVVNLSMFHQTSMISPARIETYDRHTELLEELVEMSPTEGSERIRKHIQSGKEALLEQLLHH
ncbi:MAG: GntR family transcriptional regulator [Planctomycetaceae bacterium]|nr:GntR family transcriptional regulator [Planctomycetaceae bacterium]